ncbi:leader peptidase (prepilin peptidase)/N-methyltransferase [Tumebacillus sp. BK434]|uniref:prepilin peptidase n=1 Tax=Tumebacillus sp. BK434 TaxID=2512169 RepID=UPI0010D157A7|nr:A24 family peptidase [Tumebacillus sp. BK434]TCP59680.1 leader peptidase (prepilin peptidase)/N-methyltransferase [Tumebacillus sp. BK434]
MKGRPRSSSAKLRGHRSTGVALSAFVLPIVVVHGGFSGETGVAAVLFLVLILLTVTDLQSMLMPNRIVYPSLAILFLLRLLIHQEPFFQYLLGCAVGFTALAVLGLVTNGMGGGDVKVFALIGLVLGVKGVLLALFFSCLWGTLIGLPLLWTRRIRPGQHIPFGPFILLGTFSTWAYGGALWGWYWQQWSAPADGLSFFLLVLVTLPPA